MSLDSNARLSLPLLEGVPAPFARTVLEAGRTSEFEAGTTVFAEGQPATSFYVLLRGSVKLVQLTDAGEAIVFRLLAHGDAFGTMSVLGAGSSRCRRGRSPRSRPCSGTPRRCSSSSNNNRDCR